MTLALPEEVPKEKQLQLKNLLVALQEVLPCSMCAEHWRRHMEEDPVEPHLAHRSSMVEWMIRMHNKVNELNKKPIQSKEEVLEEFQLAYDKFGRYGGYEAVLGQRFSVSLASGEIEDAGGPRFVAPKGLACANKGTTNLGRFQRSEEEPLEIMVKLTCDVERKCLQLLFGQGKKKLGFIPTEVKPGEFILRGMWVNEELRGRGLASLFLALWLKLCLMLEVTPLTDRIHKPILSLVLQKFGFVAATSHLKVEVATCEGGADEPKMLLWSESKKLSSYFSVRARRDQGIRLVDSRPEKSRTAFVNTTFSIPDIGAMASLIDQALAGGDLVLYESQRAVSLLEDLRSGGWPHWAPMPKAKGVLAPAVTTEPLAEEK
ncbi:unnamed protein product, partial [Cladocopium goreaui]